MSLFIIHAMISARNLNLCVQNSRRSPADSILKEKRKPKNSLLKAEVVFWSVHKLFTDCMTQSEAVLMQPFKNIMAKKPRRQV